MFQACDIPWNVPGLEYSMECSRLGASHGFFQALNILASHGWVVRSSMVVSTRTGDEHHHLMARPMAVMMPVSPWLEGEGTHRGLNLNHLQLLECLRFVCFFVLSLLFLGISTSHASIITTSHVRSCIRSCIVLINLAHPRCTSR